MSFLPKSRLPGPAYLIAGVVPSSWIRSDHHLWASQLEPPPAPPCAAPPPSFSHHH
ncbi:hypothetical protein M6B38_105505 [Iris pallida]|uniref:Uncharacterized protein n=1 Tax=Iris pallida TaxID=29817 RepID=A0AAX6ESG9_IRIPA|nr:hypothetical protein M6B38_105505 [Iris pallida]